MGEHKLGLFGATSITLVAMAGTGMFFGPAIAARIAGPASLLAWLLLAVLTVCVGLVFAELVIRHPKNGGVYEYAKQAYGRFPSFLLGWLMWLVATINTSLLIVAALSFSFPQLSLIHMLFFGLAIMIALHVVAYIGLGASSSVIDFFAVIMLLFAAGAIVFGIPNISAANYTPFWTVAPISLLVALFFILETTFGWEAITFLAEETKDPQTTLPKAIITSSIIAGGLAAGLAVVLLGVVPGVSSQAGVQSAFTAIFGDNGLFILRAGVFLALIGSAAGNIVGGPRLVQAMAKDKLFIAQLAEESPRTKTPGRAILFQGIVSSLVILAALGQYEFLLSIMVPLGLLMYAPILVALPVLRKKEGRHEKQIPGAGLIAVLCSILFFVSIIAYAIIEQGALQILLFAGSLILFGLPIYLLLSTFYNPSTQLLFADYLSLPAVAFERFIVPKKIREHMTGLFGNIHGKTVLELGAGVGSLTLHLAELVGLEGNVIALESGKNNATTLVKRLKKRKLNHVKVIHDEHANTRIHPEVPEVDAVFSLGMLGLVEEKQPLLTQLARLMPDHAPVCFVEWVDYLGILPDPPWLSDFEKIRREFAKAGFQVHATKVKGLLWNYLVVYGVRSDEEVAFA